MRDRNNHTFTTYFSIDESPTQEYDEFDVDVKFHYSPWREGDYEPRGIKLTPDDPPEIELLSVTRCDNNEVIDPTGEDKKRLEEECWDYINGL